VAATIQAIVDKYGGDKGQLVSILQDVQAEYCYLPKETLEEVSRVLHIPLSQVYSVASFFRAFSLTPRGKHVVTVCLGTACHVRGAPAVLDELGRQLGVEPGKTTEDMQFTLETVNCLGACALGPIVVMDGQYHGQMSPVKAKKTLKQYSEVSQDDNHG